MTATKGRIGSTFESFLDEQGIREKTTTIGIKRVLAWQLAQAMVDRGLSKNQMAKQMQTSRSQLDQILDPDNDRIQLDTILKAARVLGREVRLELV